MAPALRFPFLANLRTNSSQSSSGFTSPTSPTSYNYNVSSPSLPNSKAERILGGPDLPIPGSPNKSPRREKNVLRKLPSFMSVGQDETSHANVGDDYPTPTSLEVGSTTPMYASKAVRRLGSSPLLGYRSEAVTGPSDYFSNSLGVQQIQIEPSLTSHSSLNAGGTPRITSIQNSSSSSNHPTCNESALRNDLGSRITPGSEQSLGTEPFSSHGRNQSLESKLSSGSKHAGTVRRRPSVTDRPTLHPNAAHAGHAVSPPPALITSSIPTQGYANDSEFKIRPKWWQRSRPVDTAPPQTIVSPVPEPTTFSIDHRMSSLKVHVKKPKAGTHNWFDNIDEDDVQVDVEEKADILAEEEAQESVLPMEPPRSAVSNSGASSLQRPTTSRKSSFSSKTGSRDRKLSFRLDYPDPERSDCRTSTALSGPILTAPSRNRSLLSGGRERLLSMDTDLQIHSVLNLSSSDDEDDDIPPQETVLAGRLPGIRASVDTADFGSDVSISNAQSVQPARPRPVVSKNARRRSPRRSKTPETIPPVPQIPARPAVSQRNSSLRWHDSKDPAIRSNHESFADSMMDSSSNTDTPLTTPISARGSLSAHRKKGSLRGSKLMKVTSEEEKLLEAMRKKRASIRVKEFEKGFNQGLSLRGSDTPSLTSRPKTAGAEGSRESFGRSYSFYDTRFSVTDSNRSSTKSSRRSLSPIPLLTSAKYSAKSPLTLMDNAKTMSSDDLLLLGDDKIVGADLNHADFPFPPTAPPPKTKLPKPPVQQIQTQEHQSQQSQRELSPPKHSPSLSVGATSDGMTPSTPSTANYPLTPPPTMMLPSLPSGLGMLQQDRNDALCRTMSESSGSRRSPRGAPTKAAETGAATRHERKRTVSSIVVLDGVEIAAREADEARDIVGWALDSY